MIPPKILIVDDSHQDAELLSAYLHDAGLGANLTYANSAETFHRELAGNPDVIVTDFRMPGFGALEVLESVRKEQPDTPVIIVSGTLGEEAAVATMRDGAVDFLLKDRLGRLPAAIERAAALRQTRRAQREAMREVERSDALRRMASRLAKVGAWTVELPERRVTWTDEARAIFDLPPGQPLTWSDVFGFVAPEHQELAHRAAQVCLEEGVPFDLEMQVVTARQRRVWVRSIGEAERTPEGAIHRLRGAVQDISEQKAAGEESRLLAERLATTLESITDAFYAVDHHWRVTYVNAEAERILGRTRDELLGQVLWEEFPGARESALGRRVAEAAASGVVADFEEFYPPFRIWINIRVYPSSKGVSVYFRDVSERKAAETELAQSRRRLELILASIGEGIYGLDRDGRILFANPEAAAMFGWPAAEMVGREAHDILYPKRTDGAAFSPTESPIYQTLKDGEPRRVANGVFGRRDGSTFHVEYLCNPMRDEGGGIAGAVVSFRDIRERKSSERKLAEQADLIDQASDAIIVQDLQEKVTFWNKGAARLYGWSKEEAVGRRMAELLPIEHGRFDLAMQALRGTGAWSGELEQVTKTKDMVTVAARWTLLRDERGQPERVLAMHTDITDRKRIEAQLLRAQRLESIGTLAGGIAHDLNNLLAPIVMGVGLLKRAPALNAEQQLVLETIERSVQRGTNLVRQVLSFARGVEGSRVTLNIRHLIQDVESIVADTFPKNILFERRMVGSPWLVTGDPTQLNQVLVNLCVNARDAMPSGGRLSIEVENEEFDPQYVATRANFTAGRYVAIRVTDTGVGIPRELIDKIFEPFFTTKAPGKGTGLGLPTSLAIVRSHGGFIDVSSAPGRGTTFAVFLPAQMDGVDTSMVSLETAEPPQGGGEWVLFVDDELPIRSTTRLTLEAYGYRVFLAEDGAEAIGLFAANQAVIKAVVTDMMMPVMDGHALIAAVHRLSPLTPVIVTSGNQSDVDRVLASAAGPVRSMSKPYSARVLLEELGAALGKG